jgi:protein O-GlcNAcase/histone acetyltransferase
MVNPNCEYGANFVAINTLAQWSKCKIDGTQPFPNANTAVTADIRLEGFTKIAKRCCAAIA